MKRVVITMLAAALVCGCASWTPGQKKAVIIVAGVLVAGAIAAHSPESAPAGVGSAPAPSAGLPIGQPPGCTMQPNGTCR